MLPRRDLRHLVHGYFQVDAQDEPIRRRVVPDGCVDLLFNLGGDRATTGSGLREPETAIVGLLTRPFDVVRPPRGTLVGVTLSPHVARALLQAPMTSLTDRILDLSTVWGSKAAALLCDLRDAGDASARAQLLDDVLGRLIAERPPDPWVGSAIALIRIHGGRLSMRSLAERLEVSERSLQRRFAREAGVSPKQLSRIARVQAALARLSARAAPSWSVLANDLGFADQAHLIREFRAMTGSTPARFRRVQLSVSFNTALGDGASVQL
jgi:AraC-like DNA-binding protein